MCGRYLTPDESDFERHWQLAAPAGYLRSFNVAPSRPAPIVRARRDGTRVAECFVWGFQPPWARRSWINARSETVFTANAFADSARRRRCLVAAAGWYEWQGERAPKQPFVHYRDGFAPIAFAGIWTPSGRHGEPAPSFAILTRAATPALARVHDRMPVVLDPADYGLWLAADAAQHDLERVLAAAGPAIETRPVSTLVNKPANDDARCIEPLSEAGGT